MYIILLIILLFILFLLIRYFNNSNEHFQNINYNTWFNNNIDLFFINLSNSTERKNKMINQLNNLGINYKRFNAYNGNKINKNFTNNLFRDFNVIDYKGNIYNNKKGSLGNFISQLTCWYNFYLESPKPYIMIMEDDIILDKKFNSKIIYEYIKLLKNKNWTILKFFCFKKRIGIEYKNKLIKASCNKYNYRAIPNTGMQCYIVNKKYIKDIINQLLPINNDTFDWKIKYIMMKNNIYITKNDYLKTPNHNKQSDRKHIDNN